MGSIICGFALIALICILCVILLDITDRKLK